MKFSKVKTMVGLGIAGVSVVLLSAWGEGQAFLSTWTGGQSPISTIEVPFDPTPVEFTIQTASFTEADSNVALTNLAKNEPVADDWLQNHLQHQQSELGVRVFRLNDQTPAANMRSGPGTEFDVTTVISADDTFFVKGRTEGYWLQIKYQGQTGWLAGDLVDDQALIDQLPVVDFSGNEATPETETQSSIESSIYTGIGVSLDLNQKYPVITRLMENQPAQQAGIRQWDVIVAVDGESMEDADSNEVRRHLEGKVGDEVVVTLARSGLNQYLDIAVTRAEINAANVAWVCDAELVRGFGNTWRNHPEVHTWLGCPFTNFRRDEHATRAAVQTFEGGWMLWLETDTVANVDPIYVFFEEDGSYIRYGDRALVDAHGYAPTPAGFYKVGDRFAKVYWEEIGPVGRAKLGHGTNEARDSQGAFQEFENGRMFWAGEADTIYVIYQGNFDFDNDGQPTWVQSWRAYEDTFETSDEE